MRWGNLLRAHKGRLHYGNLPEISDLLGGQEDSNRYDVPNWRKLDRKSANFLAEFL